MAADLARETSLRVYTFRHGTRITTRSQVFLDYGIYGEPDAAHTVDYYFWVVQSPEMLLLIDTGFEAGAGTRRGRTVLHDPVEMLRTHLSVMPEDVDTVVLTHCHYDHLGNADRFPNAQIHVAEDELEFVRSGSLRKPLIGHFTEATEIQALARASDDGRVTSVRGETELAPGITLIPVGGHTPGQLMVEVTTAAGRVLLASDALHFFEELERDMPFISSMDVPATYRGFDAIRSRIATGVRYLVPGHDARALDQMSPLARDAGVIG